jgi:hypothetical protein
MTYKFNSGALFRNTKKTSDKQPDYQGEANICDLPTQISGWIRTSKAGTKYLALSFRGKDAGDARRPAMAVSRDVMDDDIPF